MYVHGYMNTFYDAAGRSAGFAHDLNLSGPIIAWMWPSDGYTNSYAFDEDSSKWTTPHFLQFLQEFKNQLPNTHLNLVAHSMGNRILLGALKSANLTTIDSVLFAAPDEARDVFSQTLKEWNFGKIKTLYGSENDRALYISRYIHSPHGERIPRAGDGGTSILIIDGVESVDASALDAGLTGHSYVFSHPKALDDINKIIKNKWPATKRGLKALYNKNLEYWAILP